VAFRYSIGGVYGILKQVLHPRDRIYADKQWLLVKWFHNCGTNKERIFSIQGINYSSKGYHQGRLARL
jgi:hypothetical protein